MPEMLERLVWPLRKLLWKIEEKVAWPVADAATRPAAAGWWGSHWQDLLLALVLGVVAYLSRRHGLPTNGLWLDDSITGAGVLASPSELLVVSVEHPGFTVLLAGWSALTGGGSTALAHPALVAGTLGPPLLYLALRSLGFARAVSLLLGAALVAAQTDIVYSGRVRTYTIDLLIVLAVVMILPRLTRIEWRWQTAVAWVCATFVLATFSIFAMIAVSSAAVILLLHPARDLWVRAVAVGAQAAAAGALFAAERATYDNSEVEDINSERWDTFVEFDPDPVRFGEEILLHLRRVGETLTGNPEWLALACILVALAGLAVASFRPGPEAIRARFLLLIVALAFGASLAGKFPFGAAVGDTVLSDGHRWSLWLIPVLAIGLAVILQRIREPLEDRRTLLFGFDAVAMVGAVLILVSAGPALPYPFPGKSGAAEYIESELGPRDHVLLPFRADWSFAVESDFDATVTPTPESSIGFRPGFSDPRIGNLGLDVDRTHVSGYVQGSEHVFVYYPEHPYSETEAESRATLASSLRKLGFQSKRSAQFGDATVEEWGRDDEQRGSAKDHGRRPPPDGQQAAGLPQGWRSSETGFPMAPGILACLDVSTEDTTTNSLSFAGPESGTAFSELILWPSSAGANDVLRAFNGPEAPACVGFPLEWHLETAHAATSVKVESVKAPRTLGAAVAFQVSATAVRPGFPSNGTFVFFTHGRAGVLISGLGVRPFPSDVLSSLIAKARRQLKAIEAG